MSKSCIYYDDCTMKSLSTCCGAEIEFSDICSDCGEHASEYCEDCDEKEIEYCPMDKGCDDYHYEKEND